MGLFVPQEEKQLLTKIYLVLFILNDWEVWDSYCHTAKGQALINTSTGHSLGGRSNAHDKTRGRKKCNYQFSWATPLSWLSLGAYTPLDSNIMGNLSPENPMTSVYEVPSPNTQHESGLQSRTLLSQPRTISQSPKPSYFLLLLISPESLQLENLSPGFFFFPGKVSRMQFPNHQPPQSQRILERNIKYTLEKKVMMIYEEQLMKPGRSFA